MKKYALHPATFKLDGGAMFGIIPKPLWEKKITPDEKNRILMSLRVIYIETDNKKILIDTGIGNYHSDKFKAQFDIISVDSPLEKILGEQFNISPDDITDVILTHLHFDHVGGLGKSSEDHTPVFKNAIIHVHQKHYDYAMAPTLRDKGSFQDHFFSPILDFYIKEDRVNFLNEMDGEIIRDGSDVIEFKTSFGHTPYMIHPIFDGHIYMADLVPMSHHISIPWVMGYDIEPGTTTVYKEKFYKYILENDLKLIFEHDMDIIGGNLGVNERKQFILTNDIKSSKQSVVEI